MPSKFNTRCENDKGCNAATSSNEMSPFGKKLFLFSYFALTTTTMTRVHCTSEKCNCSIVLNVCFVCCMPNAYAVRNTYPFDLISFCIFLHFYSYPFAHVCSLPQHPFIHVGSCNNEPFKFHRSKWTEHRKKKAKARILENTWKMTQYGQRQADNEIVDIVLQSISNVRDRSHWQQYNRIQGSAGEQWHPNDAELTTASNSNDDDGVRAKNKKKESKQNFERSEVRSDEQSVKRVRKEVNFPHLAAAAAVMLYGP